MSKKRILKSEIQHIIDSIKNGNETLALIGFNVMLAKGYDSKKLVKLIGKYVKNS